MRTVRRRILKPTSAAFITLYSWFSYVALTPNAPDNQPIWLEKVTDEEYK